MNEHQERVVEEKQQLDEKRGKLTAFFATREFTMLSRDERSLLEEQSRIMAAYSGVLQDRIALFAQHARTTLDNE